MKLLILLFLAFGGEDESLAKAKKFVRVEQLKKEAADEYKAKNYAESFKKFQFLADSMGVSEPSVWMNYGHAAFMTDQHEVAQKAYQYALVNNDKRQNSIAYQQMGVMAAKKQRAKLALEYFKNALLQNPANEDARYNYELMLKIKNQEQQEENKDEKKEDKKDQEKKEDQQNKDQEQKKEEQQDQKGGQKEEKKNQGDKEESDKKEEKEPKPEQKENRFDEIKISEEKAKMILEALKNNEVQYYQQLKKKPQKQPDKGLKDW